MKRNSSKRSPLGKLLVVVVLIAVAIIAFEFTGTADKFINLFDNSESYTAPQIKATSTVKVVEISEKDTRIKAAQEAKSEEVEAAAQAAYNAYYSNAMIEIKAQVLKEMEAEFREERTAAEKEIGSY